MPTAITIVCISAARLATYSIRLLVLDRYLSKIMLLYCLTTGSIDGWKTVN